MTADRKTRIDTGCKGVLGMLRDGKDSGPFWKTGITRLKTLLQEEIDGADEFELAKQIFKE
jgi:hypothetical protein